MLKPEQIWHGNGKGAVEFHHAYGLAGPREEVLADVLHFLEKTLRMPVRGNPDVLVRQFGTLNVDESRRIKELQMHKALSERKVLIIVFNSATSEAQNALLKVLEEPVERTHIFLIVPRLDVFFPTVRSRLFTAEYGAGVTAEVAEKAKEFLAMPVGKRLDFVKKLATEVSDEKIDKQYIFDFVNQIERVLWRDEKKRKQNVSALEEIAICRKYIQDISASIKMLLEHLALVLPTVRM